MHWSSAQLQGTGAGCPAPTSVPSAGVAMTAHALHIGGFIPVTTVDFPGELAAVVFCQGCPWRCRYCHNSHLLARTEETQIPWSSIEALLERRRGLLDAAVFSGGEPTMQSGLHAAMERVKFLGFKVGLHTAGCYPRRLRPLLPLLDWVGLDIKALPEDYPAVTGVAASGDRAWESLTMLLDFETNLEVRTTLMPDWTLAGHIEPLMRRLAAVGVTNHVVQTCSTRLALDPVLASATNPSRVSAEALLIRGNDLFPQFTVR